MPAGRRSGFLQAPDEANSNHCFRAQPGIEDGMSEEVILACLLTIPCTRSSRPITDMGRAVTVLCRKSSKLRDSIPSKRCVYDDTEAGYEYPDSYRNMFGEYMPRPLQPTTNAQEPQVVLEREW